MDSFEFNKIFAALLVAGITAMLGGFIAEVLMHPHELHEDAVAIDGGAVVGGVVSAGPQLPEPILHLIATADVAKGEKISKACAACHSFDAGGPHKVGPNLHAMVGAAKAGKAGFAYSDVLIGKGGAWSYEDLNYFLWKPKAYAPGTKMNYLGLKKPQQRADLIAWLRAQGSGGIALPNDAEIAAEAAAFAPPEAEEVSADVEGAAE